MSSIDEIRNKLITENERIQDLQGYHHDGSMRIGVLEESKAEFLDSYYNRFGVKVSESYLKFNEDILSSASFSWLIDSSDFEQGCFAYASERFSSFNSISKTQSRFLDKDHLHFQNFGDTHLLNCLREGYLCLNYKNDGPYILIKFEDKDYKLFLLLENGSLNELSVNLNEYFDLMVKTRGMFLWQAYVTVEYPELLKTKEYDGFFENMEILFPEVDLNQFKHRDSINKNKTVKSICQKYGYLEKFHNVFENLPKELELTKINKKYTIAYNSSGLQVVRNIEHHLGVELPESFKSLYWRMDGFSIKWMHTDSDRRDEYCIANFTIASLIEMFGKIGHNRIRKKDFNNAAKEYEIDEGKEPELENKFVFYRDPYCHLLLEFPRNGEVNVWLHHLESDTRGIELVLVSKDFSEVIESLIRFRGMFFWCLSLDENKRHHSMLEYFTKNVNDLFPE